MFVLDHERFYLNDVNSIIYDYGDRVEVLVGSPSEMQLPVSQGIGAAYTKACDIAEACGYTAYLVDDGHCLVCNLHEGRYVLVWSNKPGKGNLLSHVIAAHTTLVAWPAEHAPELWARLESQLAPEAN